MVSLAEGPHTTSYYWDFSNRLVKVELPGGRTDTYAYDCRNRRLLKKSDNEPVYYNWDGNTAVYESSEDLKHKVLYLTLGGEVVGAMGRERGDGKVVSSAKAEHIRYYHGDGVGSVVAITDERGNVVRRASYKPFGEVRAPDAPADDPHGYVGQYGPLTDNSTGLVYMVNRYYVPLRGDSLSRDPLTDPLRPNVYKYAANSPANLLDAGGSIPVAGSAAALVAAGWIGYGVGCAFQVVFSNEVMSGIGGKPAPYMHCFVSCNITKKCGELFSNIAGIANEVNPITIAMPVLSGGGPSWPSWSDIESDLAGNSCAKDSPCGVKKSCADCCAVLTPTW